MKKKILALVTIVTLVVAMLPITTLAEEYETSLSFTCTPVTRENIDTVIEKGNDVSSNGAVTGWAFFKNGELKYIYDSYGGWAGSDYREISKPENFDNIDQVLEKIEFKNDVKYNAKSFTGVTANDVELELTTIPYFPKKAASGYCFINPTNNITNEIDVFLLFDLETVDTQTLVMGTDNPKTADNNSALPYGCAAVASLVLIGLSIRKIKHEK